MLDPEAILQGLDPEQLEAVTNTRGPLCIIAGAGTGKTRVITHRIAYAVATGVADPQKVLALTFTAKAAGEMRSRLRGLGAPNVAARTFHSAALKQLMYFWPYSFGGQFPKLLTSKGAFLVEALERSDSTLVPGATTLREISSEIEWAKAVECSPADYIEAASAAGRKPRIPNGRSDQDNYFDIAKVYQAYETLKLQERVIDFEDVLLLTVGMLEEDRDVRERVRDQYRYFTVDEYQDVSPLQQKLLDLWLGDRSEICVVGDSEQTIYSFAGATSSFLLGFTKRYRDAKVVRLNRGYRSSGEIIAMANQILRKGGASSDSELVAMQSAGERLSIGRFDSAEGEVRAVADEIASLTRESSDIAILARTNAQLQAFESALASRGIATQLKSSERFFDRVDVRDAMRAIRSASVLPCEGDWIDELSSTLKPFGEKDYVEAFMGLARAMKRTGVDGPIALRTFLREIEDRADQNNPPTLPGVALSTLHGAKGLEWGHVFLVGVSDGLLPFAAAGATQIDEERRLFYVGVTRAQAQLHISYSGAPSEFLNGLI
jgi:DNA helicase-2/ATP-dependent DNA helicase PcrA